MGLDTSHDCFHGAYSSFTRWRHAVAEAAGFQILPVKYADGITSDTIMLEWHWATQDRLMGVWDKEAPHPLYYLFVHSDCEGVIRPQEGIPLADALEGLLPELSKKEGLGGHIDARGGTVSVTKKFIDGLREAAAAGEDVDFH
jgi:hypothetical protein